MGPVLLQCCQNTGSAFPHSFRLSEASYSLTFTSTKKFEMRWEYRLQHDLKRSMSGVIQSAELVMPR